MTADNAPQQPFMSKMVEPPQVPISLPRREYQGQITRLIGCEKSPLKGSSKFLRLSASDESPSAQNGPVRNQLDSLCCGKKLSLSHSESIGKY